jgi:hypothetical protein
MSAKLTFGGSNLKDIERMLKRLITSKEGEGYFQIFILKRS